MLDSDRIWDAWRAARATEPALAPEEFAARHGGEAPSVMALLEEMLALESAVPAAPLMDLALDDEATFAGFELGAELGRGGAGIVYRAREATTGRAVALKIINPLLATTADRRAALLREAQIASRLDHPGIVSIVASGVEHGYAWLAMDLVEGRRLDELVEDELSPSERRDLALDVGSQLAAILEHAHAHGVIHRDLKPANVIVDREGRVHVLDFGLAKSDTSAFAISHTGDPIGTPLYMAPEQLRGEHDVGPPTDLYALGLILLELATGRRLEPGRDFVRTMSRIARGKQRLPRRLLHDLPPDLRQVVARCTEPDSADRYPDAPTLARDLEAAVRGRPLPLGALSSASRSLRYARRHPLRVAATTLGMTAITCAGWWLWWNAPVEVRIDTYDDGKEFALDGVRLDTTTPFSVRLRPGTYEYETWFEGSATRYSGTLDVPHRESLSFYRFLEPFKGLDSEGYPPSRLRTPESLPNGSYGWLQVATNLERMLLTVDRGGRVNGAS